jgi:hypothetical protein
MKRYGRKRSWPNLRSYTGISLWAAGNLSQDRRSPGRYFIAGPLDYEAGVLILSRDVRFVGLSSRHQIDGRAIAETSTMLSMVHSYY